MNRIKRIFHYLINDRRHVRFALLCKFARFYSDVKFLKKFYKIRMGKELNLDDPKALSEKLQWLKLNDRKSDYTQMVDKLDVKNYVENVIGKDYTIPTLGVYNSVEDIDFDALPNQFVLKCTHDSGGVVICKDKTMLNIKLAKNKLAKSLKQNYYYQNREWPYKNVCPRIIAEKYMVDGENKVSLYDYKVICFNGEPKILLFCSDRANGQSKWDFFDADLRRLPIKATGHETTRIQVELGDAWEEMKSLARKVSHDIPYLSVDFYYINSHVYIGELTFYSGSGCIKFEPEEWDYTLGSWIDLSTVE